MGNQAKSVERSGRAAIGGAPRTLSPHRQFNRPAKPLCVVGPETNLFETAIQIRERIRSNRRARNCGSYLLATDTGEVFVLNEQSDSSLAMVTKHPQHFVGLYAADNSDGKRGRAPKPEQLYRDLAQHFEDIGVAL